MQSFCSMEPETVRNFCIKGHQTMQNLTSWKIIRRRISAPWNMTQCRISALRDDLYHAEFLHHWTSTDAEFLHYGTLNDAEFLHHGTSNDAEFLHYGKSNDAEFLQHWTPNDAEFLHHGGIYSMQNFCIMKDPRMQNFCKLFAIFRR